MVHKESIKAKETAYVCTFRREPEGGYTVRCPKLPPVVTHGSTLAEARANAREAVELCLEILKEAGKPIPPSDREPRPTPIIKELVRVKAAV